MSGTGDGSGWRRAPGWLKLLLIVSLALNVAVIGMIGGTAMRGGEKTANEPGLDRRQSRILRMVPEARRDAARAILIARSDEYAAAQAALKQAQMDLIDALRSDPYDRARVSAALEARREASGTVWGIGYEQLEQIAADLNGAERSELADRLEERTRRWLARQEGKSN